MKTTVQTQCKTIQKNKNFHKIRR